MQIDRADSKLIAMRDAQKTQTARRLRRDANVPEKTAWAALRTLRAHGVVVRRQHPVGAYVVDFAIVAQKVAIEIDGGIHRLRSVAAADLVRQTTLEAMGWRIIRVAPETALSRDHLLALVQQELGL